MQKTIKKIKFFLKIIDIFFSNRYKVINRQRRRGIFYSATPFFIWQ